jgi:hypothetical protein
MGTRSERVESGCYKVEESVQCLLQGIDLASQKTGARIQGLSKYYDCWDKYSIELSNNGFRITIGKRL